jgi:hypothetical protein
MPGLVLTDHGHSMVHDAVNRQIRRQTMICCVSASGATYCPLLAPAKESVSRFFDWYIRDGINFRIQIAH